MGTCEEVKLRILLFCAPALMATVAFGAPKPAVTLTRLDCGAEPKRDAGFFSDSYSFADRSVQLTESCYLIRHGDEYMIWDAGSAMNAPTAPKKSLVQLLQQLQLTPDRIQYLAISHFHSDHIGQADSFPRATLLMGQRDWDVLSAAQPPDGRTDIQAFENWRAPLAAWFKRGGVVKAIAQDLDVFGDGAVVMLSMPGHTPGH